MLAAAHNIKPLSVCSAAYFADLLIASAIRINQKLENIAHSRNNAGRDIIIAILRSASNSSATTRRSARIKRN
jgi:phosphoribosylcarboxyaminoimidazole (NCAIR) mutase